MNFGLSFYSIFNIFYVSEKNFVRHSRTINHTTLENIGSFHEQPETNSPSNETPPATATDSQPSPQPITEEPPSPEPIMEEPPSSEPEPVPVSPTNLLSVTVFKDLLARAATVIINQLKTHLTELFRLNTRARDPWYLNQGLCVLCMEPLRPGETYGHFRDNCTEIGIFSPLP